MPKKSNLYLDIDPFKIIETSFHKDRDQVSESIFSLANEYSGIRGFFEEGYSGKTLKGSYFNGIYEYALQDTPNSYKGIVKRTHFTINSVNWVKCNIKINGKVLDLNKTEIENFYRVLDMKSGLYERSFDVILDNGKVKVTFYRLMNMTYCHECIQKIIFESNVDVDIDISFSLDNNVLHWNSDCYWNEIKTLSNKEDIFVVAKTLTTNQSLVSTMNIVTDITPTSYETNKMEAIVNYSFTLKANKQTSFERYVINIVDKESCENVDNMIYLAKKELLTLVNKGFVNSLNENKAYYENVWNKSDIEIGGDEKNQQGIRYCIFQLEQTYHGFAKDNNIGAKGLTGEAYSGHAFWDSETYCLPYYLFSNASAAKNLLMFRYNTLSLAKERAKDLDCEGACYPIATRNGKEGCNLWQHASLQFQPSTGVFYAIYHYMNLYQDDKFMEDYGLEMVVEIAKFLLSRGQFSNDNSRFGFYNVMGPDEFQMMVNHNTYTNFMAKKVFDYLLDVIDNNKYNVNKILKKCEVKDNFVSLLKEASEKMVILYDKNTNVFEQHAGYFDLPHIDINSIPTSDFPLYSHWSYDRIYRNDMIKQPDVLMFMFLYNQDFTYLQKKANYEFYEPRCIHESSLSPSIHSIFACELNKKDEAKKFFEFATRLDLDDYNCNTLEGIHTTSIAAAWMNIVYGFGGLRSDKQVLSINPMIIDNWTYYSFKINYQNSLIKVVVDQEKVRIINTGKPVTISVYNTLYNIENELVLEHK